MGLIEMVIVVLLVLWALGVAVPTVAGWAVHILLVLALALVAVRLLMGRV